MVQKAGKELPRPTAAVHAEGCWQFSRATARAQVIVTELGALTLAMSLGPPTTYNSYHCHLKDEQTEALKC